MNKEWTDQELDSSQDQNQIFSKDLNDYNIAQYMFEEEDEE